jgi:glycopeptide antibiotics resistance protein
LLVAVVAVVTYMQIHEEQAVEARVVCLRASYLLLLTLLILLPSVLVAQAVLVLQQAQ